MGEAQWLELALTAAVSGALGFALGRARWRRIDPAADVPGDPLALARILAKSGVPLDLVPGLPEQAASAVAEPLARCIPRSAGAGELVCELVDGSAAAMGPGGELTCFFAPQRLGRRRINAFATGVVAVDLAAEPPRITLRIPEALLDLPRRRHARKKVSDPRFVRLRLWLADYESSRTHFPTAPPDVWINAYDGSQPDENAVTDISAGGMALEVRAALVPRSLEPGSPVVLKCSLFQFREKQFRPYWYAGLVRGVTTPPHSEGRVRRVSIGFTAVGRPDPETDQGVAWEERDLNATAGGQA